MSFHQSIVTMLELIAGIYGIVFITTFIHEEGHYFSAILLRQCVTSFRIGSSRTRFRMVFDIAGVKLSISPFFSFKDSSFGSVQISDTSMPVRSFIIFVAGGVIGNLLAFICGLIYLENQLHGSIPINNHHVIYLLLLFFLFSNLLKLLLNTIPESSNDGFYIFNLLQYFFSKETIICTVHSQIISVKQDGKEEPLSTNETRSIRNVRLLVSIILILILLFLLLQCFKQFSQIIMVDTN
jgi:hypothetical protein